MDIDRLFCVRNKTALITGGSRGIGYMAAEGLLAAGARVFICGRKQADLAEAAARLSALGDCRGINADLSKGEDVERVRDELLQHTPRLDILVNNAGTAWAAKLEEFPRSGFDKVFNLNVTAMFDMTRTLLPLLRVAASADDPARVINISSADALRPPLQARTYSYSASKAAVLMLTRHLAAALLDDHITVNAIAPGLFETKMTQYMFDPSHPLAREKPSIPMQRAGRIEDIAGTIIYLSSRAGSYLTGATIAVSGGIGTI